jgi:hypothetical protein
LLVAEALPPPHADNAACDTSKSRDSVMRRHIKFSLNKLKTPELMLTITNRQGIEARIRVIETDKPVQPVQFLGSGH